MLSVGSTTSSSHVSGSTLGSPTRDHGVEDNTNVLTSYLQRVAGYLDKDVNTVLTDHCYARPWNWKPENIYVKPTKNIFFSSSQDSSNQSRNLVSNKDENIDVEDETTLEQFILPCNLTKARQSMDESQKLVNFIRPDDNDDNDWEESVEKTFWSPIQRRLFTRAFNIFRTERLSRLTKINCATELFHRRSSIDIATKRFRETLASTGWDWKIIQWLHTSFISNLSREYLVIYLDILQKLRAKIPQLIDKMITPVPPTNNAVLQVGSIPLESLNALLKRPWDPISAYLNANRPKKLPGNPIIIVISSGINANLSSRHHKWITQLGTLGMVITVHSHLGLSANRMTITACMDQLVQVTRAKIQDVRNDYPGRPMILVGLNTGGALACQVAQMEHVTAVICLGFPFFTVEGKRGNPDDMLMDIRCPVMFVIGQNASLARPDDLEDIRGKMLVETSLVVVGTADDHLRISTAKIISEGITQDIVDRCILDEIGDFVGGILLQPHPLPLRPIGSLINFDKTIIKKEPRKRKNSTSSSIDSESNFTDNIKKTRPCTSSIDRYHIPSTNSNLLSISKTPTTTASPITTTDSVTLGTFVSGTTSNVTHSIQRRNSRVSHNQKSMNSYQLQLSRQAIQQNINTSKINGGLTLNIGSLASLAPIGPIRLTPNLTGPTTSISTAIKPTITSKSSTLLPPSSITFSKASKIIQTSNNTHNLTGKFINTLTTTSKTLSKTVGTNSYNRNINNPDQVGEAKLVTVYTSGGNQVRVASKSNTSVMQNKSMSDGINTPPLTAILHSRKNSMANNNGKLSVGTSTNLLRNSPNELSVSVCCCSTTTTGAPTSFTTATTKVMENSSSSPIINLTDINQDENWKNIAKKFTKITSTNSTQSTMLQINDNIIGNQVKKLSLMNKSKNIQKLSDNTSIITINSKSQKNNRDKTLIKIGELSKDLDNDLGNILDIPIIFAKDDDNLNAIEKTSLSLGNNSNNYKQNIGIQVGVPLSTSPTTAIALLNHSDGSDNKQQSIAKITNAKIIEKTPTRQFINTSELSNNHVILQTSNVDSANNGTTQANSMVNLPTLKYTKIILSKRNFGNSNSLNNQIILTKNSCKSSSLHLLDGNQN